MASYEMRLSVQDVESNQEAEVRFEFFEDGEKTCAAKAVSSNGGKEFYEVRELDTDDLWNDVPNEDALLALAEIFISSRP